MCITECKQPPTQFYKFPALNSGTSGRTFAPFCHKSHPTSSSASNQWNRDGGMKVSCTPDAASYGYCNLVTHQSAIPPQFVYFVNSNRTVDDGQELEGVKLADEFEQRHGKALNHVGGKIALANYCPYYQVGGGLSLANRFQSSI